MQQYIKLETKRFLHTLPGFFLSVITVMLLALLILLAAKCFLPEALAVKPFRVGLYMEGTGGMEKYVYEYIRQMESAEGLVEFVEISFDEMFSDGQPFDEMAFDGKFSDEIFCDEIQNLHHLKYEEVLENKDLMACIIIPERTAESIINGTNIPVQVFMRAGADHTERYLQQRLLVLLTECGAVLIDVPQAETLLLYEMQVENVEATGRTLDLFHIGLVLGRDDWFEKETISVFGSITSKEYYLAAGLSLTLIFWGLGCGSFLRGQSVKMPILLERRGISLFSQQLVKQVVYILWYLAAFAALYPALFTGGSGGGNTAETAVSGGVCAAMLALQCVFFFELAPTTAGGILLNGIWGLIGFFGAGGLLPVVFLPKSVAEVCGRLPAGICMELLRSMAGRKGAGGKVTGLCLLWCLVFGVGGQLMFHFEERRRR